MQKNLIANTIGSWVDDGFLPKAAALNTTIDNWALAVAFGIQIYFDFAAYSNMAIGAAQMIGITLPENFRFPYHAANPVDFWSRWHMTLSRWILRLRLFPSQRGLPGQESFVSMSASWLSWVSSDFGMALAGDSSFGASCMEFTWPPTGRLKIGEEKSRLQPLALRIALRLATLGAIVAAWIPFRAVSLEQAMTMLEIDVRTVSLSGLPISVNFYLMVLFWCVWIALEPTFGKLLARMGEPDRPGFLGALNGYLLRPVGYAVLLLLFMAFDDRDTQFIYFQF